MASESPIIAEPVEWAELEHEVWREIHPELQPHEFRRPELMDVAFLRLLSKIRRTAGVPFRLISDARDPEDGVGVEGSAHEPQGDPGLPAAAVDLDVWNAIERGRIVRACYAYGLTRIGVYPGQDRRAENPAWRDRGSLHLDASRHDHHPDAAMWTRY